MLNQPKNIYPPIHIYVADTGTDIGRGVFAVHSFSKDDIVEISPVILIENLEWKELPIELRNRVFNWKKNWQNFQK